MNTSEGLEHKYFCWDCGRLKSEVAIKECDALKHIRKSETYYDADDVETAIGREIDEHDKKKLKYFDCGHQDIMLEEVLIIDALNELYKQITGEEYERDE